MLRAVDPGMEVNPVRTAGVAGAKLGAAEVGGLRGEVGRERVRGVGGGSILEDGRRDAGAVGAADVEEDDEREREASLGPPVVAVDGAPRVDPARGFEGETERESVADATEERPERTLEGRREAVVPAAPGRVRVALGGRVVVVREAGRVGGFEVGADVVVGAGGATGASVGADGVGDCTRYDDALGARPRQHTGLVFSCSSNTAERTSARSSSAPSSINNLI